MFSMLALTLWIGGLVLFSVSPWLGASLAAAGHAVRRPDDMAFMFGVLFMLFIGVSALRVVLWGWERLFG